MGDTRGLLEQDSDPLGPDAFRDRQHHPVFEDLRENDPVHWHTDSAGCGFWCLTKHADVQMANRDPDTFIVGEGFTLMDIDPEDLQGAAMAQMLPGMDRPQHTRYRRIVNRGFSPRTLRLVEDHLALKAKTIVDRVVDKGSCDFVDAVASELPLQAIAELLGIPEEDRRKIFEWSNRMTGIDDPEYGGDMEDTIAVTADMMMYADELRHLRTRDPQDDIVTVLTGAASQADGLTDAEFGMFFLLLVVAGNETTRNATSHGMQALIENPEELEKLRRDPSHDRMARAVEEILRWASPILYFRRTATRDVELRGKTIKAGDRVVLWYASANRDPEAFPDPFRFDVDRWPNDHVAFGGGGPHFCLGANLARMELRLIFTELVTRMPRMELDGSIEMLRSNFVGGIKRMPVRWDPGERPQ
jgi:cholest-4-en-3-one 26-monooxygenase